MDRCILKGGQEDRNIDGLQRHIAIINKAIIARLEENWQNRTFTTENAREHTRQHIPQL